MQADTCKEEGPRTSAECGRTTLAPLPPPTNGGGSGEPDRWVCEIQLLPGNRPMAPTLTMLLTPSHPAGPGAHTMLSTPPCNSSHKWEAWHIGVPRGAANRTAKQSLGPSAHTHICQKRDKNWTETLSQASPLITHGFVPAAVATASARAAANTLRLACTTSKASTASTATLLASWLRHALYNQPAVIGG